MCIKFFLIQNSYICYCSGKDTETIENTLSQEMELIAKYFDENELVMI